MKLRIAKKIMKAFLAADFRHNLYQLERGVRRVWRALPPEVKQESLRFRKELEQWSNCETS